MKLVSARCGARNRTSPRAKRCSVWPKWNIDILSKNAASRTRFFQAQAIKAGPISIISTNQWYIVGFQQGRCSREVTDENFKKTLQKQILQIHRWKNRPLHFARMWEIKIRSILLNTYKTALIIVYGLSYPSRRSKPPNPILHPAVQW